MHFHRKFYLRFRRADLLYFYATDSAWACHCGALYSVFIIQYLVTKHFHKASINAVSTRLGTDRLKLLFTGSTGVDSFSVAIGTASGLSAAAVSDCPLNGSKTYQTVGLCGPWPSSNLLKPRQSVRTQIVFRFDSVHFQRLLTLTVHSRAFENSYFFSPKTKI